MYWGLTESDNASAEGGHGQGDSLAALNLSCASP
jgi:hypothetical protein